MNFVQFLQQLFCGSPSLGKEIEVTEAEQREFDEQRRMHELWVRLARAGEEIKQMAVKEDARQNDK